MNPNAATKRWAKVSSTALRAEFAYSTGEAGSLEAVIAEHGYSTESVRRLFQSGVMESGFAPVGVLADFLEVEGKYEGVVEDFLRDELNYIVVKSWDAADEGLRLSVPMSMDARPSWSSGRFAGEIFFHGGRSRASSSAKPLDCAAEEHHPAF